ncbi:hypothetical protein ACFOWX_09685 [Sphingorhabdus arenilitoris]|uniref:Uncharacterized protein n=1 Tax=Sphingorhabdus arenilitoris TaxID=1490041 RepID=A0ABV8RGW5_9SPHN
MAEDENRTTVKIIGGGSESGGAPETDWDAVYEQQMAREDKPKGVLDNPALKFGCGCVFPFVMLLGVLGSATVPSLGGTSGAYMLGSVFGMTMITVIMVWGPLYLFWLRDQTPVVMGSTLAATLVFGILFGMSKYGSESQKLNEDLTAISEYKFDQNGAPIPSDEMANAGPISAHTNNMITKANQIADDYDAELVKMGLDKMMTADQLTAHPGILRKCADIRKLRDSALFYKQRQLEMLDEYIDGIDTLDTSPAMKDGLRQGILSTKERSVRDISRKWDIHAEMAQPLYDNCRTLARRNWQAKGPDFLFSNDRDMNEFIRHSATINRLLDEQDQIIAESQQRAKQGQENLKSILPKNAP